MNAAAKDAELYLRRCRKLEDVIADLLTALEVFSAAAEAQELLMPLHQQEQIADAIAKAKAAL